MEPPVTMDGLVEAVGDPAGDRRRADVMEPPRAGLAADSPGRMLRVVLPPEGGRGPSAPSDLPVHPAPGRERVEPARTRRVPGGRPSGRGGAPGWGTPFSGNRRGPIGWIELAGYLIRTPPFHRTGCGRVDPSRPSALPAGGGVVSRLREPGRCRESPDLIPRRKGARRAPLPVEAAAELRHEISGMLGIPVPPPVPWPRYRADTADRFSRTRLGFLAPDFFYSWLPLKPRSSPRAIAARGESGRQGVGVAGKCFPLGQVS